MNERTREKERESIREEVWLLLREGLRKKENKSGSMQRSVKVSVRESGVCETVQDRV